MTTELKKLDFSLLIPCYNNWDGLLLSIKSVQYFPHRFMIVVVDDGSTVPVSVSRLQQDTGAGHPLIVLRSEANEGITHALNIGLEWIETNTNSKYVARLDCGDTCDPQRFYKQVDYMDQHPGTGLLGSWCIFENRKGTVKYQYRTPVDHQQIKTAMHFRNVFIHPTVIFKTSLLQKVGYYSQEFLHAEDYAFFWKLMKLSTTHILPEFLVTCELNHKGISFQNRRTQLISRARLVRHFGTNRVLKSAGTVKMIVLQLIPLGLILYLKKLLNRS